MKDKNPTIAAVLSFLFAGLGQFYNGQPVKGVAFLGIQVLNIILIPMYIGMVTFPLTLGIAVFDAYRTARVINLEHARGEDHTIRHRERGELYE